MVYIVCVIQILQLFMQLIGNFLHTNEVFVMSFSYLIWHPSFLSLVLFISYGYDIWNKGIEAHINLYSMKNKLEINIFFRLSDELYFIFNGLFNIFFVVIKALLSR